MWYNPAMKIWLEPQPVTVEEALRSAVGGHPVVAESLVRRGITSPDAAQRFLNPAAYTPAAAADLPDMDKAVSRLQQAIRQHEPILIWGDFDVDGQTSTALLVSALRDLGANVSYHIPNRFTDGHGIQLPMLKKLLDAGASLLITCDTGITAHEAIDYAQGRGVDVIITDHHSLPDTLPAAYATVNPMLLPQGHPLRELPGVGTAYKVMQALYGSQSSDHLLDLVAVGIVADVMVQVDDTRYLLQRGLDVLRNNPRPGVKAMITRAEIDPHYFNEMDIGFALAPRLNALGRLADANPAVELLTTNDTAVIVGRINELEGLNQKRKFLTRQVYEAAQQQIRADESLLKYAALVIAGEGWHTGVVGIVASRLVEDYGCPVVVLSDNQGIASGSARSVMGADIVAAIRSQAHLLRNYGGHNMAAGLALASENVYEFRRGLSQTIRDMRGTVHIQPEIQIDSFINLADINLKFAEDISRLAPFGNGNPPLTLATQNVQVKSRRTMGSRGDHLDLKIEDESGNEQRVVWWFGDVDAVPQGRFDIAYTVRQNYFKGKQEALVEWLDVRPAAGATINLSTKPTYQIVDYRQQTDSAPLLAQALTDYPDALLWSEADTNVTGVDRYNLSEAQTLIVWTVPPDISTWKAALRTVQPERIILFGNMPKFKTMKDLLTHVIGMAKYAHSQKDGLIHLSDIARLTGQSEQTIMLCLQWIDAQTEMTVQFVENDAYQIDIDPVSKQASNMYNQRLQMRFAESQAYRKHWLQQTF
jgi:single-stranded-DNA-specific exonuclease